MYPHFIFDHNKIVAAGLISLDRSWLGLITRNVGVALRLGTRGFLGRGSELRVSECRFLVSYS